MPTLHEFQSSFHGFLTGKPSEPLLELVDRVSFDRLSIYRNNMLVSLTAALKATFPVVCRLVGDGFFEYAAYVFIQRSPPAAPCLAEYGDTFPNFLADFPAAASLEYLPDVARLEWTVNQVLRAPLASASVPLASLLSVAGDAAEISLIMAPSVAYVASIHPIDQIWRLNQPGIETDEVVLEQGARNLEISATNALRIVDLPAAAWTFRYRLAAGDSLGTATTAALAITPDFDLPGALASLFEADLIVGLR